MPAKEEEAMEVVGHDHPSIQVDLRPTHGNRKKLMATDVADVGEHHDPGQAGAKV
jgi:metallophosphoesterase superfamily enzyme